MRGQWERTESHLSRETCSYIFVVSLIKRIQQLAVVIRNTGNIECASKRNSILIRVLPRNSLHNFSTIIRAVSFHPSRGQKERKKENKNSSNIKVAQGRLESLDSGERGRKRKRKREKEGAHARIEIDGKKSVDQTVEPFREGLLAAIFFHRSSLSSRALLEELFSRNRKSKRSHPERLLGLSDIVF